MSGNALEMKFLHVEPSILNNNMTTLRTDRPVALVGCTNIIQK